MQKDYLIIVVIILLENFGFCSENSTQETNVASENNKIITKTLYHVDVWSDGYTFTTEDMFFFEKNSFFSALNVR